MIAMVIQVLALLMALIGLINAQSDRYGYLKAGESLVRVLSSTLFTGTSNDPRVVVFGSWIKAVECQDQYFQVSSNNEDRVGPNEYLKGWIEAMSLDPTKGGAYIKAGCGEWMSIGWVFNIDQSTKKINNHIRTYLAPYIGLSYNPPAKDSVELKYTVGLR